MKNPYIGPDGKDIHSKEELDAILEKMEEEKRNAEMEAFYSLPLEERQKIMKDYNRLKGTYVEQSDEEINSQGRIK